MSSCHDDKHLPRRVCSGLSLPLFLSLSLSLIKLDLCHVRELKAHEYDKNVNFTDVFVQGSWSDLHRRALKQDVENYTFSYVLLWV